MTDPARAVATEKLKRKPTPEAPAEKDGYPDWRQPNPSEDQVQRLNHLAGNGAMAERLGPVAQRRATKTASKAHGVNFDPVYYLQSGPKGVRGHGVAFQGDVLRFRVQAPGIEPSKAQLDVPGSTAITPRRHGQYLEWTVNVTELNDNDIHATVTTASGEVVEHSWKFNVVRDPAAEEKHTDEGLDDQKKRTDALAGRQKFDEELSNAEDTVEQALYGLKGRIENTVANFDEAHRAFAQVLGNEQAVASIFYEVGFGVAFAAIGGFLGAAAGEGLVKTINKFVDGKTWQAATKTAVADTVKYLVRVSPKLLPGAPARGATGGSVLSSDTALLNLIVQPEPDETMDEWGHRQNAATDDGMAELKRQLKEERTKADASTDEIPTVIIDDRVQKADAMLTTVPTKEQFATVVWAKWLDSNGFHEDFDPEMGIPMGVDENWSTWWMRNKITEQVGFDLVAQMLDQKDAAFRKKWNVP